MAKKKQDLEPKEPFTASIEVSSTENVDIEKEGLIVEIEPLNEEVEEKKSEPELKGPSTEPTDTVEKSKQTIEKVPSFIVPVYKRHTKVKDNNINIHKRP